MSNILDQIVATKQQEIALAKTQRPLHDLLSGLKNAPPVRSFRAALAQPGLRVIAEVKKASPSAGVIRPDFDPLKIAKIYADHGADCLSILTDEVYFQGHLDYLRAIREQVQLPLLRKEFIIDEYQIVEARLAGADAILLIAEILPGVELQKLYDVAIAMGLDVLMELHDTDQLPRVLATGCRLVGINNRDLRTFVTRLSHTVELAQQIPPDRLIVGESGIRSAEDVLFLAEAGVQAILVGESLMRAPDIGTALQALRPHGAGSVSVKRAPGSAFS